MPTSSTPNLNPGAILHTRVDFSAIDVTSNSPISEPFTVSGPSGTGIIVVNLPTANKAVIQLTNSTSAGASYLKIHYPQPSNNKLYVTYAKKNSIFTDGYEDFNTTISAAFKADLLNWIKNGRTVTTTTTLTRTLTFSAYGLNTNQPSASVQFTIVFSAVFSGVVVPSGGGASR